MLGLFSGESEDIFIFVCILYVTLLSGVFLTFACILWFFFFSENILFGMGNPLLDITAVVDKDFLDK